MTADRSLDEFTGTNTGDDGGSESTVDNDGGDNVSSTGRKIDNGDPSESTSTWTAVGTDCEQCGETGMRRWLDEGSMVCLDCKEW